MKLIIDIPNDVYESVKSTKTIETTDYDIVSLFRAVKLGKERPQGEWIDYSNEGYVECPFCGSATNCEDNKDELNYCWNCGAKMKNEQGGECISKCHLILIDKSNSAK